LPKNNFRGTDVSQIEHNLSRRFVERFFFASDAAELPSIEQF
jgi:hypothetical protein